MSGGWLLFYTLTRVSLGFVIVPSGIFMSHINVAFNVSSISGSEAEEVSMLFNVAVDEDKEDEESCTSSTCLNFGKRGFFGSC